MFSDQGFELYNSMYSTFRPSVRLAGLYMIFVMAMGVRRLDGPKVSLTDWEFALVATTATASKRPLIHPGFVWGGRPIALGAFRSIMRKD
jgi:hypothetical protein